MACISLLKSPVVPHLFSCAAMTVNQLGVTGCVGVHTRGIGLADDLPKAIHRLAPVQPAFDLGGRAPHLPRGARPSRVERSIKAVVRLTVAVDPNEVVMTHKKTTRTDGLSFYIIEGTPALK